MISDNLLYKAAFFSTFKNKDYNIEVYFLNYKEPCKKRMPSLPHTS